MATKVSQYFCVFCSFKCDEYGNAFNHYRSHMFAKYTCEACDYNQLYVYSADLPDLDKQCDHIKNAHIMAYKHTIVNRWIATFLSYQTKILNTTYRNLLSRNKVCVECAVCRYLVDGYKKNGGHMDLIQYIEEEDKWQHCYEHLKYDPKSIETQYKTCENETITDYNNYVLHQKIRKLDAFITHWCDTFFTGDLNDEYNLVSIEESDSNSVNDIHTNKSLYSDNNNDCSSQLSQNQYTFVSPSVEDFGLQSLAPIFEKLSAVESNVENINQKLLNIESNHSKCDCIPTGIIDYFADNTAPNGWLKANGQTVSRTEYANLFATIGTKYGCGDDSSTFTLPDLRGEFIRGWSDGRDVDKERCFGSAQIGSNVPIYAHSNGHEVYRNDWDFAGNTLDGGLEHIPWGETRDGITYPKSRIFYCDNDYYHCSQGKTIWSVMKGMRPRNIALFTCIKY